MRCFFIDVLNFGNSVTNFAPTGKVFTVVIFLGPTGSSANPMPGGHTSSFSAKRKASPRFNIWSPIFFHIAFGNHPAAEKYLGAIILLRKPALFPMPAGS